MQTISFDDAKAKLEDLIKEAIAGKDIFIDAGNSLTIQLVPHLNKASGRQFGSAKGLMSMSPDFDEPLEDFKEYQC